MDLRVSFLGQSIPEHRAVQKRQLRHRKMKPWDPAGHEELEQSSDGVYGEAIPLNDAKRGVLYMAWRIGACDR